MSLGNNKKLAAKVVVLAILLASVLFLLGCVRGLQPIGWSGASITDDGTIYTGSKEGRLVSIDTDGRRQWSEPLKTPSTGGFGCGPSIYSGGGGCAGGAAGVAMYATPEIWQDLVFASGYNGKVYAFNSQSLQLRWIYPREDYLKPIIGGFAVGLNNIYFGCSDNNLYALDAATGDRQWIFPTGDKIWSTPVIDGEILYVGSFDKKMYALNADNGTKIWEYETGGAITSTPLIANNTVYTGSFDRNLYALDATTGKKKWEFTAGNWIWAKPILFNNTIYTGCLDNKLYVLDAQNGKKITEIELDGQIASSPVQVNEIIIVATGNGKIYRINTESNTHTLLAEIEGNISAPLSATEKVVYIRTPDLTLHPLDIETGAKLMTISLKSGN